MTRLVGLRIEHLRNLQRLEMTPHSGVNLITGENGAGKTTLLEGIYLLGRGRSFREKRSGPLVTDGAEAGTVFGRLQGPFGASSVGVERRKGVTRLRRDGAAVRRISDVARDLPLILFTPESHQFLDFGPEVRRRFLDWCMFHVEPSNHELLTRFNRTLRQRNHALRVDPRSVDVWTASFTDLALKVTAIRETLLAQIVESLRLYLPYFRLPPVTLNLRPGWPSADNLSAVLAHHLPQDLERGFSFYGPHRGDIAVRTLGKPADRILSRGQKKLLVFCILLAAADLMVRRTAEETVAQPLFLLDDPFSELDAGHRRTLCELITQRNAQVFIAAIDADPYLLSVGAIEHPIRPNP